MIHTVHILAVALALVAAESSYDKADSADRAALRRVAQMPREQQQAWLRELKSRLEQANQLSLNPAEAARQNARIAAVMRQKTITYQTVLQLIRELDDREKDAIGALVQQYRSGVYRAFPDKGPAFNDRKAAWYRVWGLWQAAGSPNDQQDRLIVWLARAIASTAPGKIGPLPADPTFFPQGQVPQAVAKAPTGPAETPAAPQKPAKDVAAAIAATAKKAMEQPPRLPEPPAIALKPDPRAAEIPPPPTAADRLEPLPPAATAAQPPPRRPQRDLMAMLPKPPPIAASIAPRKEIPPPSPAAADDSATVRVNTEELTAQIAGNNMALRTLEAELDEKRVWSVEQLETAVGRLEKLSVKNKDLALFRDLISPAEQALVGSPASPRPVFSSAAAQIAAAREHTQGSDFRGSKSDRQAALRRLDELSSRVNSAIKEP